MIIYDLIKERSTLHFLWKGRNSKTALNLMECLFVCVFPLQIWKKAKKKKKKLFTLFCAMWHQSIQPSESELTASLYTHTHTHTHTHTRRQAGGTHVYILSINVNILSLVWNDVYILFQTLDIVYALEWL